MKLYHSDTSPFVRKVMILLHEAGITDQVALLPASGTAIAPGRSAEVNPLGKVPVLVLPDGQALYDSTLICRYLVETFAPDLLPEGPAKWPALVLESTANGIMEATYLMVMEARIRPEDTRFEPWVEGQWLKILRALDVLESQTDHAPLSGPLTLGHIALAAALGYLDLRLDARNWRENRPRLTAWAAQMAQRPSVIATKPDP